MKNKIRKIIPEKMINSVVLVLSSFLMYNLGSKFMLPQKLTTHIKIMMCSNGFVPNQNNSSMTPISPVTR